MARARGEGTISQRHTVAAGCPPAKKLTEDGKTRWVRPRHRCKGGWMGQYGRRGDRVTVYGKTRKEVASKLDEVRRRTPVTGSASKWTIERWMTYYLEEVQPGRTKPQSRRAERSRNKTYIVPLIGHYRLTKLQPQHVTSMYQRLRKPCPEPRAVCKHKPKHKHCPTPAMVCKHQPHHGLSEATIRRTHALLHRALNVAMREGHVERNVASLAEKPSTKTQHRDPLSLDQARQLLSASHGTDVELRVYLRLFYGLRQGEVLGIEWRWVDFTARKFRIYDTVQKDDDGSLFLGPPKTDMSRRWLPMVTPIEARFKVAWAGHLVGSPECAKRCEHTVFANAAGALVDPKRDWEAWRDLLMDAGLEHRAPHAARNTSATLLAEAGIDQNVAKAILGHSTIVLTADVYTATDLERVRREMEKYSAYMEPEVVELPPGSGAEAS